MTRCRILIADSHDVVRRSIRAVLEEVLSCFIVGETSDGPETLAKTIELEPDIVILDISLPDLNGLDVTRELARLAPSVDVVMLTMHASPQLTQVVHDAGACAYLPKTDVGRKLVGLIEGVIARRAAADRRGPTFAQDLPEARKSDGLADERLTAREREVLRLLAEGRTNKQIGTALAISAKTVETHRARIMSKLQIRSVGQLVRFAIRHGIISP
jgi:DNA-binding NarL/FixJ family response regulator